MLADLILKALRKALAIAAAEGLATLGLGWAQAFGRPLSGRLHKVEIQTLFHGNTKDRGQI
jgi:hypothetical protein